MTACGWEEIVVGATSEYGEIAITKEAIIRYAREFDPQPFHVDEAAAKGHYFGGIIASGWHTASLGMRMIVDHARQPGTSLGSPGVRELRWRKPVRPGDTLRMRETVVGKRLSRTKPGVGYVESRFEILNQDAEVVMYYVSTGMFRIASGAEAGRTPA